MPSKKCLVIVDLQKGFINEHTVHLPDLIADFIGTHPFFDSVVATRYCNTTNTACYKLGGWRDCMEGTEAVSLVPEIKPFVRKVFDKHTFSGYTDDFKIFLDEQHFDMVYFCGVNTDCCVLATVFSCYDAVRDCAVIENLCASTLGEERHQSAVRLLTDNITKGRVIRSDMIRSS